MLDKSLFDNKKAHWNRFVKPNLLLETVTKARSDNFAKIVHYTVKDACSELLPKKTLVN